MAIAEQSARPRSLTNAFVRRAGLMLAAFLLLALVYVQANTAAGAPRLVLASRSAGLPLPAALPQAVRILHYQSGRFAALADDVQVEAMRHAGWTVQVLDYQPELGTYYLAYPPDAVGSASLDGARKAYAYDDDAYLILADLMLAERLAQSGVAIIELPLADEWSHALSLENAAPRDSAVAAAPDSQVQAMVEAVSLDSLVGHVCKLQDDDALEYCNELGSRYSLNTPELEQAAVYLHAQLAANGLAVTYDEFSHNGLNLKNVVADKPGIDPQSESIYIICAHYDSTSSRDDASYSAAPGADDNASGTAAVLEAARILTRYRFSHSVRFVLFAGEEQGLIGSTHYAAKVRARGEPIAGVINLDMIGYESVPPDDHKVELHAGTSAASNALADAMVGAISAYGIELDVEKITIGATTRSDHYPFWCQGYPAVLGIEDMQDFNPHYHSMKDTLANMETSLMLQFTRAAVATLAGLADPIVDPTPTATHTCTATPSATMTATQDVTRTPTATSTALPEVVTLVLEEGLFGYDGADDAYIHTYAPDSNYCSEGQIRVGYKQQYAALLAFDLAGMPPGAGVESAQLQLYAVGWGGSDATIAAHALLREVDWCQVTWNQAGAGRVWGLPGAADSASDRQATPVSVVTTNGIRKWYTLDVTALVRAWLDGSLANRGVLLRSGSAPGLLYLASADNPEPGLRPRLLVRYRPAGGVPPTPTATASPRPSVSPEPSPTRVGSAVSVTLQQGADGYAGAEDTYLYQWSPKSIYCREASLQVGYKQQRLGLLAFELDSIPVTATVTRAALELWATGWGGQNVVLGAYDVLRPNTACRATWMQADSDTAWGLPGCNDTRSDREAEAESSLTTSGINKWYSFDVTSLVQGWVDGSRANHGVLLRSSYSLGEFHFASAQSSMLGKRPRLVITYR